MNYLVDSNIFIYATQPEDDIAASLLTETSNFYFSSITRIEVLGYNKLEFEVKSAFEQVFSAGTELSLSEDIVEKSIELRQEKLMSLGDVIIAATAIVHNLTLLTRNTEDFNHLNDLSLKNPYDKKKAKK